MQQLIPTTAILKPTPSLYRDIGDKYLSKGNELSAYRAYGLHAANYPIYREYHLKNSPKPEYSIHDLSLSNLTPFLDTIKNTKYNFVPSFTALKAEFQGWNNMVFVHPTKTGGTTFRDPLEHAIRFPELLTKGLQIALEYLYHYSGKDILRFLSHGSINNNVNAKAVIDALSAYKSKDFTGSFLIAHGIKANDLINALEESVQNKVKKILIQRNPQQRLVSIIRQSIKNNPDYGFREIRSTLTDNSLFRAHIDDYSTQALSSSKRYENRQFDCIFDVTDDTRMKCLQSLFLSSNYLPNIIYPAKVNSGGLGSMEDETRISKLTKQLIGDGFIFLDEQLYSSNPPENLAKNCSINSISDQKNIHPLTCVYEAGNFQIGHTKDLNLVSI